MEMNSNVISTNLETEKDSSKEKSPAEQLKDNLSGLSRQQKRRMLRQGLLHQIRTSHLGQAMPRNVRRTWASESMKEMLEILKTEL